eukprot:COSAG04_NODE_8382_length_983_cov_1.565611_2_plen_117_part_01
MSNVTGDVCSLFYPCAPPPGSAEEGWEGGRRRAKLFNRSHSAIDGGEPPLLWLPVESPDDHIDTPPSLQRQSELNVRHCWALRPGRVRRVVGGEQAGLGGGWLRESCGSFAKAHLGS